MSKTVVLETKNLTKIFYQGATAIRAVDRVNLKIYSGDFTIILGPSGCGKSTLLHLLLGLEMPTEGKVFLRGTDLYSLSEDERAKIRAKKFGVVYQLSNFIRSLNVVENVAFPQIMEGRDEASAKKRARDVLKLVGMARYANSNPQDLSGGEQQRVAVARALVWAPWIIVADEPTGNLDTKTGWEMIKLLEKINREGKRTILLVTHNPAYWSVGNRKLLMKDGQIIKEYGEEIPKSAIEELFETEKV